MTTHPNARPTPIGFYAGVHIDLPDRIAALLPMDRPGVRPHITLVHAQVDIDQLRRLRAAFEDGAPSTSLTGLRPFRIGLRGVGDFRADKKPMPVVYLKADSGQLGELAAALDAEFGLRRRFDFHAHVTLASWLPDVDLDRVAADHRGFEDEFTVEELKFTPAYGTLLADRTITRHQPRTYRMDY